MEKGQHEPGPINLTVGRVNTTRTSRDVNTCRSALPGSKPSAKAFDLPWTPGTGKAIWANSPLHALMSPGLTGRGSLPFFQPSPQRVSVCAQSPAGQHGFSALEAMLHSPVYSAGAGDLLGSSHDLPYRFDTPSSRSGFLGSIFASTPDNRWEPKPQPQLQSSESQASQRGFVDLTLLQALTGEQQQQGLPRQVLDLKPDIQPVQHIPEGGGAEKVMQPQAKSQPPGTLLPGPMFLSSNPFMGGLDGNSINMYSQQQVDLPKLPISGASQPSLPLASILPGGFARKEGQGMLSGLDPTAFDLIHAATAAQDPVLSFPGSYVPAAQQKSDSENSHDSVLPSSQPDADALASSQGLNHPENKSCHCKKSQCLKLYCDCFAAGLFCANCACTSCMNRPEYGAQVMERREHIITRDPDAFSNKILAKGARGAKQGTHKKGCNCKRSYCLKKYCECFQGGVKCGDQCKCLECKNLEDNPGGPPASGGASRAKASKALVFPSDHQSTALDPQRLPGPWDVVAELTLHASGTAANLNKRQRLSMNLADLLPEPTIAYGSRSGAGGALGTSPVERQASGPVSRLGAAWGSQSSRYADTGILQPHQLARLTQEIEAAAVAQKAAGLAVSLAGASNNPNSAIPAPASREMPYPEVARAGSATLIGTSFANSHGQKALDSSADTTERPSIDQHEEAPMDWPASSTPPDNISAADLFSQYDTASKLKASLMSGDGSTVPESNRSTTVGQTLGSPTRSSAPGLLSMPFPALVPKLSVSCVDPFQVSKPSRVEISPPQSQPVRSSATSLPVPNQVMEGYCLTIKAPTPRRTTPASALAGLSPSLEYGFSSGRDGGRGLDSLFMSPTMSDGFDPMQMLASPLYTDSPQGMMFNTTPSKSTATLLGLGPEAMSFSPQAGR